MIKESEYIESSDFIAEVIRTTRTKTATIKVEEGIVSVVVPKSLNEERIRKLLSDKKDWIKDKIRHDRSVLPVSPKQYVSGEDFAYLGRNYRLKINQGSYTPVKLLQGRLVTTMPEDANHYMIRNTLVRWYKRQAEAKLKQKVKRYAPIVGAEPLSVGIKHFDNRWGSCSAKGKIDFNWKIIMTPNRIVDYIVVHELCHLIQHDHSPKFWKEVERVMPDYQECREWLKVNAERLVV
jgi:predicted metal-dependent hydrolase